MPNNPTKDIENFVKSVNKTIGETVNKRNLTKYGNIAIRRIRERTRKGFGVNFTGQIGGRRKKLKPLSASYKAQRRRVKLHSSTSANKSNLTLTGQMLESLQITKINVRNSTFRISPKGKRNRDVAGFVDDQGRPFLGLTKADQSAITKEYQSTLSKLVRKRLT